jgi:hypothetical protein
MIRISFNNSIGFATSLLLVLKAVKAPLLRVEITKTQGCRIVIQPLNRLTRRHAHIHWISLRE